MEAVAAEFTADDFELVDDHADADFVLNMFDTADPKAFRRSSRGTYSASFYELDDVPEDVLRTSYPNLVRTLANVVVLHVPGQGVETGNDRCRARSRGHRCAQGLARNARQSGL